MASRWHPEELPCSGSDEIDIMASVLEGRHGIHAADVAEFLSAVHRQSQDTNRMQAWSRVAEAVRNRMRGRLDQSACD